MPSPTELAHARVDSHRTASSERHRTIWNFAEPAWREYRSAEWCVERLRREGFSVEADSGGLPTAFAAKWSNGRGPAVAIYAEYDAVAGNCPAAATRRGPPGEPLAAFRGRAGGARPRARPAAALWYG